MLLVRLEQYRNNWERNLELGGTYIIKNDHNTEKSSENLRRLAVTQTHVETISLHWCKDSERSNNINGRNKSRTKRNNFIRKSQYLNTAKDKDNTFLVRMSLKIYVWIKQDLRLD